MAKIEAWRCDHTDEVFIHRDTYRQHLRRLCQHRWIHRRIARAWAKSRHHGYIIQHLTEFDQIVAYISDNLPDFAVQYPASKGLVYPRLRATGDPVKYTSGLSYQHAATVEESKGPAWVVPVRADEPMCDMSWRVLREGLNGVGIRLAPNGVSKENIRGGTLSILVRDGWEKMLAAEMIRGTITDEQVAQARKDCKTGMPRYLLPYSDRILVPQG